MMVPAIYRDTFVEFTKYGNLGDRSEKIGAWWYSSNQHSTALRYFNLAKVGMKREAFAKLSPVLCLGNALHFYDHLNHLLMASSFLFKMKTV